MIDRLDYFVRFWELNARHASLGEPLRPSEQVELLSLMQLVTHDLRVPRPGPSARSRGTLRAELIGGGAIHPIELRSVTAAAILVAGAVVVEEGSRVLARATDAVRGVEYVLPCKVAWIHKGSPNTLALTLDGIPKRQSLSSPPESFPRTALALGRQERLLG